MRKSVLTIAFAAFTMLATATTVNANTPGKALQTKQAKSQVKFDEFPSRMIDDVLSFGSDYVLPSQFRNATIEEAMNYIDSNMSGSDSYLVIYENQGGCVSFIAKGSKSSASTFMDLNDLIKYAYLQIFKAGENVRVVISVAN